MAQENNEAIGSEALNGTGTNGAPWGAIGQVGSSILGMVPSADKQINNTDAGIADARAATSSALMSSGNPWAMAAGAAISIFDKTGGFNDASEGLGAANDTLNAMSSFLLPGAGYFLKEIDPAAKSEELATSSSYHGSSVNIDKANANAGKILFGRRKAKNKIADAQRQNDIATGILRDAKSDSTAMANSSDMFNMRRNMQLQGNNMLYSGVLAAEKGARIENIVNQANEQPIKKIDLNLLKGITSSSKNVIPSGALHKNKHHLDEDTDANITKKGIPVVSREDDGEIIQHAEIERNEIVLSKDTTDVIRKMRSDYNFAKNDTDKNNIAFSAGDYFVYQLFNNTDDNTKLIKTTKE